MTLLAFNISDSIVPQKENYCVHHTDLDIFPCPSQDRLLEVYMGDDDVDLNKDLFCHTLYDKAELRLS